MALKAGLVGVNPKGVDNNGMPIGPKDNVSETQLTANGKQFHFAYDETSEKYGYKLDGAGDFIPFESGAAGGFGWTAPGDLSSEGLTPHSDITIIEGGFAEKDGMVCVDVICSKSGSSDRTITGFPKPAVGQNFYGLDYRCQTEPENADDYFATTYDIARADFNSQGTLVVGGSTSAPYHRIIALYKKATT